MIIFLSQMWGKSVPDGQNLSSTIYTFFEPLSFDSRLALKSGLILFKLIWKRTKIAQDHLPKSFE